MINKDVKKYIENSVLCWLVTSDSENIPNVSPKEMFTYYDEHTLLIANLASPQSVANIELNANVCVSFVDIFVQKGYKLIGSAKIIEKHEASFPNLLKQLTDLFTDKFPIKCIIAITVTRVEAIQAPSYFLYPEATEETQVASAMMTYNVKPK